MKNPDPTHSVPDRSDRMLADASQAVHRRDGGGRELAQTAAELATPTGDPAALEYESWLLLLRQTSRGSTASTDFRGETK
jgi:hypothetical protein